jgi:glycosyltransferase involved in cell wall biosynthesis
MKSIGLVIPVYNESGHLVESLGTILGIAARIRSGGPYQLEILLVDDGSTDNIAARLAGHFDLGRELHYLRLNANYGKEAAISAGLETLKQCDAVIVMDSDLEHPPALIARMLQLWEQGNRIVSACKIFPDGNSRPGAAGSRLFYRLFRLFTGIDISNQSDFKLLDRSAVEFYLGLPEKSKYFWGLVQWMNFPMAIVDFEVPPGAKTTSSWGFGSLLVYAIRSITTFTALPLQLVTLFGGLTFLLSLGIGAKALYDKLTGVALDGFTTVIFLLLIIGSVLMFSLGIIGIYIARIYEETKGRPAYIIDRDASVVGLGDR